MAGGFCTLAHPLLLVFWSIHHLPWQFWHLYYIQWDHHHLQALREILATCKHHILVSFTDLKFYILRKCPHLNKLLLFNYMSPSHFIQYPQDPYIPSSCWYQLLRSIVPFLLWHKSSSPAKLYCNLTLTVDLLTRKMKVDTCCCTRQVLLHLL